MSVIHQSAVRSLTRLFSTSATKYKPYIPKNEHKFKFEQLKIWEHVYGISSVLSALRAKKRSKLNTIFIQASDNKKTKQKKDDSLILEILQLAKTSELKIVSVDKGRLNSLTDNRPHQGVVLRASPIKSIEIDALTNINGTFYEALPRINKRGNQKNKLNSESISNIQFNTPSNGRMPFWIALDEVQDPQNLGSILRTAYFFGVDGVLICSKNSAPLSPTVSKVSSGAVEMMDIYSATNLAKFLKESHTNGWEIIGAVGDAQPSFNPLQFRETYDKPVILVLGNEGTGLRTNIRNECNRFISIPSAIAEEKLNGSVDSLNVGVAAGIIISSALLK
ncbi:Alpha/beta knot methyltransferase [Cokeromyces recurvatus]|uniref:Alpha/beta knot methyltransferase n=1 Tax=Cokeromyces recurvatus TaxID=90255 RepID=UPI002220CEE8|nr:Alpha/beta knot methyltransferase [Cokeromyces recurvatus]KAI7907350.1 Alpha/beta knot methyltransferase [Cokeromyces recurvatus]